MATDNKDYDPNLLYEFTDKNGNTFTSKGDNKYVWQAITEGVPISLDSKGNWYINPTLEVSGNNVTVRVPSWFKNSPEYNDWKTVANQIPNRTLDNETVTALKDVIDSLGNSARFRTMYKRDTPSVTNDKLISKYIENIANLSESLKNKGEGEITLLGENGYEEKTKIKDLAKLYNDLNKESLSESLKQMYETVSAGASDEVSQEAVVNAQTTLNLLNLVKENSSVFGDEYSSLFESSLGQKANAYNTALMSGLNNITTVAGLVGGFLVGGPIGAVALGALSMTPRVAYGISEVINGNDFSLRNEELFERALNSGMSGVYLTGTETAAKLGGVTAAVASLGVNMSMNAGIGSVLGANVNAGTAVGKIYSSTIGKLGSLGGSMVTDFIFKDIPLDLAFFVSDWASDGFEKALYNPEQEQYLFQPLGLPAVLGFDGLGPKVAGGLGPGIISDIVTDVSFPMLELLSGKISGSLDAKTNGAISRTKEKAALANLKLQEHLTNIPVFGTAWQKFVNHMMGSSDAEAIRQARKTAIAENSMDAYIEAQVTLRMRRTGAVDVVYPLFERLENKYKIQDSIKEFQSNRGKYGGVGEVRVEWHDIESGAKKDYFEEVKDTLPKTVKDTLLDVDRLSELKGQQAEDGGLVPDAAREKEIAELEQRIEKVREEFPEILDFADRFSNLNKDVERLSVHLGISTEEWVDALQLDPRFEKYMTRQMLVPGRGQGVGQDGVESKIWNASRKGGNFNRDKMLDPTISLYMKVRALGQAYAWNETAKMVVANEIARGTLAKGKGGVETAKRLEEVKNEIKAATQLREAIKYDAIVATKGGEFEKVANAVKEVNNILHSSELLALQSVFGYRTDPGIQEFVSDFNAGKIKFADGAKENVGISDTDAAVMIQNTYHNKDGEGAGIATDGTPYTYKIADGEISDIKKVDDFNEMAKALEQMSNGIWSTSGEALQKIGGESARGVLRAMMFYKDNYPALPTKTELRINFRKKGAIGYAPAFGGNDLFLGVDDSGHIYSPNNFGIYLTDRYRAARLQELKETLAGGVESHHFPKNTEGLESVPIHENGHSLMSQLAVLRLNKMIDDGELDVKGENLYTVNSRATHMEDDISWEFINKALESMGYDLKNMSFNERDKAAYKESLTISKYAANKTYGEDRYGRLRRYEIFSEAMNMYAANGQNSSKFCLAIVNLMTEEGKNYSAAVKPLEVAKKNGIISKEVESKYFNKDGSYKFPSTVKKNADKAKWLDGVRKKNPFNKGKFDAETYKKANLWDTFFQKEIEGYDRKAKSSMPESLVKRNGDFLEDFTKNAANKMIENLKQTGVKGLDTELATMVLSNNPEKIQEAMNSFIIAKMNETAEALAANMEGGATVENLNKARITVWSEEKLKNDVLGMMNSLIPDVQYSQIRKAVDELFDTQAKGFASVDKLPIETSELLVEKENLATKLEQSNKAAQKYGEKLDKELKYGHYSRNATHVIRYRQGGEDVYVVVSDPVIASVLEKPDYKKNGILPESVKAAADFLARTYTRGTTGWNPLSFVRNVLRDPIQAAATAGHNPLTMNIDPMFFYRTLRGYGLDDATIKTVTERLKNWSGSSTFVSEMRKDNFRGPADVSYSNRTEKAIRGAEEKIGNSKIVEALEMPLEKWESFFRNQVAQQAFVKNYRKTGDVDKAMTAAMFNSANATTDFSGAVGLFKNATSTVPYLSSAINGTASFWRLFNMDPIGMITRITSGFMVPVMAITAWNLSDEDRRNAYMNLDEWYRDSHIVLVGLDGNMISFPVPDELNNYFGTARRLIEYTQEASQYSLQSIFAQGVFGFLPGDINGFWGADGSINVERGVAQFLSGLMPQAVTAIYEFATETQMYTGQDLSTLSGWSKALNTATNIFGTGFKSAINSIGIMLGVPEKELIGLSFSNTLSRDLFGTGFHAAKNQFMEIVGSPAKMVEGKYVKATGLFAENEKIQTKLKDIDTKMASATGDDLKALKEEREQVIEDFTKKVSTLMEKYMQMFSITGGLEEWQKKRLVQVLTMGQQVSGADDDSYESGEASEDYLAQRGLAMQQYVKAGLPAGPSFETMGSSQKSIEVQEALNRFYGVTKQANYDLKNAISDAEINDIRNKFYNAVSKIYDIAEENNVKPDYDMIEKIQARYLQSVDAVLAPLINQYGINILNNNDFIDQVRKLVNGMVPTNDWKKSEKNAKKYLSAKEFPLATVDVKDWLKKRYTSGMVERNLASDPEVTNQLKAIKADIDGGRKGAAKGKIESLRSGINKSQYYISATDFQTLTKYYSMVK